MAVFYSSKKSSVGTNTGSIIMWSKELASNDPDDPGLNNILPQGYLRCDGSIYSAESFPLLAAVLGTGNTSRYRKPDQVLLDNQFQLPDYGSKKVMASSSGNVGDYLDTFLEDDNNNTISKSGVGITVVSNIGTTYEVAYQGSFFLPSQQIPITGEPGFIRSTGNYTEPSEVLHTAMLPHAHFHDGLRSRIVPQGDEFSAFQRNSYTQKSTLCVVDWANNTRQDLCYYNSTRVAISNNSIVQSSTEGNAFGCRRDRWNACWNGCLFQNTYQCLIPEGYNCQFPLWGGDSGACGGSGGSVQTATCGNIEYSGTMIEDCGSAFACAPGGLVADPQRKNTSLPANYTDQNLPFDSSPDIIFGDVQTASLSNITQQAEPIGNDGLHRHFIEFAATPQTFVVNTRPTYIEVGGRLTSTISIRVNESNKADQFIQPYIVQEFLIKY